MTLVVVAEVVCGKMSVSLIFVIINEAAERAKILSSISISCALISSAACL